MLLLSVTFTNPLLHPDLLRNQPEVAGSYRCTLDGLISGMRISPDRIWNALGRRVTEWERLPPLLQCCPRLDHTEPETVPPFRPGECQPRRRGLSSAQSIVGEL